MTMVHLLCMMLLALPAQAALPHYNDFHYPLEEPIEMASVSPPRACAAADGWSLVFSGAAVCVLERSFEQWGLISHGR